MKVTVYFLKTMFPPKYDAEQEKWVFYDWDFLLERNHDNILRQLYYSQFRHYELCRAIKRGTADNWQIEEYQKNIGYIYYSAILDIDCNKYSGSLDDDIINYVRDHFKDKYNHYNFDTLEKKEIGKVNTF